MTTASRFGPRIEPQGGVTFRLWAPAAKRVDLVCDRVLPLSPTVDGWFELFIREAESGFRYRFRVDGELDVPDPASHFQPDDVSGPSEVVAYDYAWRCTDWSGRPWSEAVFMELHVGTFTPAGTFRGVIERLDHLVETGVTAIELMPVADFPGRRNWGYDGVLLYAPDSAYGRPDDLKALVDAAHARGLMVFLDVVYNHFGPEGNYLGRYAPSFFTSDRHTPWGDAIDYRVPQVRAFAIENALHWLRHYRFDGLRLDAVHAIEEAGEPPVLEALSRAVGEFAKETGRHIHLVLENDDNRASLLDPATAIPAGKYRAQWDDDYHHVWHTLLTGEGGGYYADYAATPREGIARSLASGFVYQGDPSSHRKGSLRGEPSGHLPPAAFVNFLQNHDQIGNRAFGERLTSLVPADAIDAALAVTLLAPSPPLLFMGEEWGATQPFPFFCDFSGDLAEAVRNGRAREFEAQFRDLPAGKAIPDPLAEDTFRSAALNWADLNRESHSARWEIVRALLRTRRREIVPLLDRIVASAGVAEVDGQLLIATWTIANSEKLRLLANLGELEAPRPLAFSSGSALWNGLPPARLPAWAVYWQLEAS